VGFGSGFRRVFDVGSRSWLMKGMDALRIKSKGEDILAGKCSSSGDFPSEVDGLKSQRDVRTDCKGDVVVVVG
jgi:hypothetical protein